jgi:ABC-type nitrate/sulfonate/bicarbonate transport system substrate-binding protein
MIRRRTPLARFLMAAVPAAFVTGVTALTAGDVPPEKIHLKALFGRYLSFAPLAIAGAEGYFTAQGLDVELVHSSANNEAISALIQGEIDVAAGMLRPAEFNAIARGAALRLVADKGHYGAGPCVSSALMARPEFLATKHPDSPEHLRGARVSATPLSFAEYVLETFVNTKGLRLADLNVLKLPEPAAEAALEKGSLDFQHIAEPFLTRAIRSGRVVVWKPVREIVPEAQLAAIYYGPSLLTGNRDVGRRFMVAYLEGVRQYNLGKTARNVEIISKETGLDPDLLREACWETIRGDGKINLKSVLDYQRWAVRRGLLDAPLPPEKFWDPSFIDEANRILGPPAP